MENIIQTAIQNQEMIIAIIALVMSIIATWLTISLYRKVCTPFKERREQRKYSQETKDLVVNIVRDSNRINNYILGIYRKCIAENRNNSHVPQAEISTAMFNDIVETVLLKVEKRLSLQTSANTTSIPSNEVQQLYASSYDVDEETFYEVSKQPSDQSIFSIAINPQNLNKGIFEVYGEAYGKVQECKDFLEYCCEIEGSGTNLQTIEKGEVVYNGSKWTLVNKLKIRFS